MNTEAITDTERYPTLTREGQRMLEFLREHPHAPIFRNQSGNRLTADDVTRVREFDREAQSAEAGWRDGELPGWTTEFVEQCLADVPFFRRYGSSPAEFQDLPTISRGDLSRDIAQFVPDSAAIDRLINFRTSGTTGHPLLLASHPVVAANYLAFHKRALQRFGIDLQYGRGQVGVVLVGFQRKCFTYVSVNPTMDESGLAKINLHYFDWRDPSDRAKYLDALAPEIYTGDPIAFSELAKLSLRTRPRALLSTSMTLLPALREQFEERFDCPVLDLYSLNEAGPVAVADASAGGHVLLQPRLYVEILDDVGHSLPAGTHGEVTLTGGFNFCLPLLRYRTGDYAALRFNGPEPVLVGLEGRPPVRFRTMLGEWVNNIEVTHALQRFAIPQFTLHQDTDGMLLLRFAGPGHSENQIRNAVLELFGQGQPLALEQVQSFAGKIAQYTSSLAEAQP
jgi:phenylacetate-coenzyme A ligase PaaK-like adenylate-forming protein